MRRAIEIFLLVAILLFLPPVSGAAADVAADTPLSLNEADNRLAIAERLVQGGVYLRAVELAGSILDDPVASGQEGTSEERLAWLKRRETARFLFDRGRVGLAETADDFLDAATSLVQLSNNRYRLPEPVYAVQAAYWAARAYEEVGVWREAVDLYGRVGGSSLPQGMEGDAARRMSKCLRMLAEEIPYQGSVHDRQQRDRLLNQAIAELDRARLAFPIGDRRKEIELDLIALRLARRDEHYIREAATDAEAFIESDPARDSLRARAVLYRGQAAASLGEPRAAADWFGRVLNDESPSDDDRRQAELGLGLALLELSQDVAGVERNRLLSQAATALDNVVVGTISPGPWDGARIIKAQVLVTLDQPSAALETLAPVLSAKRTNHRAWRMAGLAELARGRLGEAVTLLYASTHPSNQDDVLRYLACREASKAAESRRDLGFALALNHQASRMLRRDRLFSSLLASEFQAMEIILKMGRMGGPMSISGDIDLLMADSSESTAAVEEKRAVEADRLAAALGRLLGGGDPDSGYNLAIRAEAAAEWSGSGKEKLELAIGMISHLGKRQPKGITDSVLLSRLGEARHALALARAAEIIAADQPLSADIDKTLGDFAAAAAAFNEAVTGGGALGDSLDQGMVNMESGAFLMRLAERWDRGSRSAESMSWRNEARQRIEASLRPFNLAIATSAPSSLIARRAKWSRGRALELMGEWRGAAADYLSLMNNSELSRVLRANAARRWAVCMGELGESRQALVRLSAFADSDAEAALLSGKLAESAGMPREAYERYLFAASLESPSLPPATPGRREEAAYRAARLALSNPGEADPFTPPNAVIEQARTLLEQNAVSDPNGEWTVPMLNLLGESWLDEAPDGWRRTHRLAEGVLSEPELDNRVKRAMYILAARATAMGGNFAGALDELDAARELVDGTPESRLDAALITLETARIYKGQDRRDDALRAYADVFAVYPEAEDAAEAARREAALMLLTSPDVGDRQREQARSILSGLRDQVWAEKTAREYGLH